MLSVYSNLPKYRQLSYFELNQPKWKLETSNKWMKCFLDMYISHIMCLRKQKKLFSSADTANKIHHLKSPLMLSVYHNLLYPLRQVGPANVWCISLAFIRSSIVYSNVDVSCLMNGYICVHI